MFGSQEKPIVQGLCRIDHMQIDKNLTRKLNPYWKCNFPMTPPVHPLVGRSVCHNFPPIGSDVTLPCSYKST